VLNHPVSEANTPFRPEEPADLIPSLATREELNEWERDNILHARQWAFADRQLFRLDPIREEYIRELHRRMFDQTWKWAGTYRKTHKNLGVPIGEIRERLTQLLGHVAYWLKNKTYDVDECCVRFHYELVVIRAFPDGHRRQARLIADVLAAKYGRPAFSWGKDLMVPGKARNEYLSALQKADQGQITPLLKFARA
jgi:Fic-DOC domain mobile mystery protein B